MSTDLNEYFDAFEDFDDEKTMTPDSSPGDDNNAQGGIHEWMRNGGDEGTSGNGDLQAYQQQASASSAHRYRADDYEEDYEEELEDDLQSNCSALTVETITDQYLSAADTSQAAAHYGTQRALALCPSR